MAKTKTKSKSKLDVFIHAKMYENNISAPSLLKSLGISQMTFYKRLKTNTWNLQELKKLAEVLEVSPSEIYSNIQ